MYRAHFFHNSFHSILSECSHKHSHQILLLCTLHCVHMEKNSNDCLEIGGPMLYAENLIGVAYITMFFFTFSLQSVYCVSEQS